MIPYRFRGAVQVIFSLLSMDLVKLAIEELWASKIQAPKQLDQAHFTCDSQLEGPKSISTLYHKTITRLVGPGKKKGLFVLASTGLKTQGKCRV